VFIEYGSSLSSLTCVSLYADLSVADPLDKDIFQGFFDNKPLFVPGPFKRWLFTDDPKNRRGTLSLK
jgi:hypothetical protein